MQTKTQRIVFADLGRIQKEPKLAHEFLALIKKVNTSATHKV